MASMTNSSIASWKGSTEARFLSFSPKTLLQEVWRNDCLFSCQVTPFIISSISRRAGLHFLADGFAFFAVGAHEFVVELEVHPHAGGDAKKALRRRSFFRGAAAFALFHLGEVGRGSAAAAGDLRLGQVRFLKRFAKGLSEEVEQRDELRFLFHGGGSSTSQSSIRKPVTRLNSRVLWVTSVRSSERAWPLSCKS